MPKERLATLDLSLCAVEETMSKQAVSDILQILHLPVPEKWTPVNKYIRVYALILISLKADLSLISCSWDRPVLSNNMTR
jgi:hypothetical protein